MTAKVNPLSEEGQKLFDSLTSDMTPAQRSAVHLLVNSAYTRGSTDGFCRGLDKGMDICNGSPIVAAKHPLDEVATDAHRTAAMGTMPIVMSGSIKDKAIEDSERYAAENDEELRRRMKAQEDLYFEAMGIAKTA